MTMSLTMMWLGLLLIDADLPDIAISKASVDQSGLLTHEVRSPFQVDTTLIRILLPKKVIPEQQYPVVYLLPVEAGVENRYGDGLKEVMKHDLHNHYSTIFVAPTFSHLPWYADHPTKKEIRQESYFMKVVHPFIKKNYPVRTERAGHHLLGFSKSGWGAWCLLLRHPEVFERAVAWDAPLMMNRPGMYGSGEIFGTATNFENYQITKLIREQTAEFKKSNRLILHGFGNFREQHVQIHELMTNSKLSHIYQDGPHRKHDWHSGWVPEAVKAIFAKPNQAEP